VERVKRILKAAVPKHFAAANDIDEKPRSPKCQPQVKPQLVLQASGKTPDCLYGRLCILGKDASAVTDYDPRSQTAAAWYV
jgi:hypothetical protein